MDAPSQNCFAKLASCSEQPVNTSNPGEQISWDSFSEQGLFLGPVSMVTQDASLSSFAPPPPENGPFGNCHKQSLSLVIWGSSSACGPGFCRGHSLGGVSQASESKPQLCDVYSSGVSGEQLSLLVLKSVSPPRNGRIK